MDLVKYEVISVGRVLLDLLSLGKWGCGDGGGSGGGQIQMDS